MSRGPESFQQCSRVSRSSGDRFPPLWMIFDDLHLWSLLNCWEHMRANVANELVTEWDLRGQGHVVPNSDCQHDFKLRWRGAEHHREDTETPEQSSRTLRIQHIDFSMFTLRVGILQTSLWRFCGFWRRSCRNWSVWGSAKILAAQAEHMAFIRLRCLWTGPLILIPSGLGVIHTTRSTLTALVQYLCSNLWSSRWLLKSCGANLNCHLDSCCLSMLGACKVVPGFLWSCLHARLKASHGAHWVLVCFSHFVVILLVTCWHLSSSIFVHFWFSSGFLSNRLKLLPATPLMFANTLWQKHGRQLRANSFSCPWYVY